MNRLVILLVVLAGPAAAQSKDTCVDVRVGTAKSYDCLNQKLGDIVASTKRFSAGGDAPYSANSPSNVTGQYNQAATRERLGSAFGHSAIAQRPTVTYVNPVR